MKKGALEEAMSKARFVYPNASFVQFRDKTDLVQVPVAEFWKVAEIIPEHRIARVFAQLRDEKGTPTQKEILYESIDQNLLALPVVIKNEIDPATLRFVEMRDVLAKPTIWRRYPEVEPIRRLPDEGRELLGRELFVQEKRDGENCSIWLEEDGSVGIASHNMSHASPDIIARLQATKEYKKIIHLLEVECKQYDGKLILYGELIKTGRSPTGIEGTHKYPSWVMFDIFDITARRFINYNGVYQKGYDYKIPTVRLVGNYMVKSMEELQELKQEWLKWARRHHREGVCIKCYDIEVGQPFAKERVDLPKLAKIPRQVQVQLPEMPPEKIQRALEHTWDELANDHPEASPEILEQLWKEKSIIMPKLARHLAAEAAEHHYSTPRNMYKIYLETPIEKLKPKTP